MKKKNCFGVLVCKWWYFLTGLSKIPCDDIVLQCKIVNTIVHLLNITGDMAKM